MLVFSEERRPVSMINIFYSRKCEYFGFDFRQFSIITETSLYKSYPRFAPNIYQKWGKSGVRIKTIKSDNFQYFSIKSYVVGVY